MSIQQSTELVIFVTHVEAENSFLKIWGQVDKNSASMLYVVLDSKMKDIIEQKL